MIHPLGYCHHPVRGAIHFPRKLVSLGPVLVFILGTGEVVLRVRGDEGGRSEDVQNARGVCFAARATVQMHYIKPA